MKCRVAFQLPYIYISYLEKGKSKKKQQKGIHVGLQTAGVSMIFLVVPCRFHLREDELRKTRSRRRSSNSRRPRRASDVSPISPEWLEGIKLEVGIPWLSCEVITYTLNLS